MNKSSLNAAEHKTKRIPDEYIIVFSNPGA